MKDYKISVIIPIYNAESSLESSVRCLLESSSRDMQIILADDGSTDSSPAICDALAAKNPQITVIHKANGGVSSARNAGLDAASGEWIGFLDADDTVEPDMYEYLIGAAEKAGADIAQGAMIMEQGDSSEVVFSPPKSLMLRTDDRKFGRLFSKHVSYGSCCKVFKRCVIGDSRFDESTAIGEDFRFNLDAISRAGSILVCPKPIYHYVQSGDSATHTVVRRDRLTSFRNMIKKAESDYAGISFASSVIDTALLLDVSDTASKAVLNGLDTDELFDSLRGDVKKRLSRVIFGAGLPVMQRAKLLTIAFFPKIYKRMLTKHKRK